MDGVSDSWLAIGLLGQTIFSMRFVLQWIYSEYKRQSTVPMVFWYASLLGGTTLLRYAIHKQDPVFMVGQSGGLLIYLRNLQLRMRESRKKQSAVAS
ncbi:lipid-A-disaccharide synthase N-terminal domain-containing protein [Dyella sp. Tek66A03]|uniref:lipid-A-disaccharide synthase N-terminal domain-containing protein n=1 Tax=Dyella sp. Tek66A03 TaxID=3458298 RepID=UPI00403E6303